MKHAWQFVLDTLDYPFVCKINQCVDGDNLITRAGYLRNVPVSIGGTTWKPDMPIEFQIKEEMAEIKQFLYESGIEFTFLLGQETKHGQENLQRWEW